MGIQIHSSMQGGVLVNIASPINIYSSNNQRIHNMRHIFLDRKA